MRSQSVAGEHSAFDIHKTSLAWNVVLWALALCAFAYAMVQSYHATHAATPVTDLRTLAVLLLNASLATAVAVGFAARQGTLARWSDPAFCFRFGIWAAAVFRLLSPSINESGLYDRASGSFDVPYFLLGACIHGGLAVLLAWPCAVRVLYPEGRPAWREDQDLWEMCGAAILIFFIVAGAVRLLAAAS